MSHYIAISTLGDFIYEFCQAKLNKNTRKAYTQDLRSFGEFTKGSLTDHSLMAFRNFVIEAYAPRTANRMLITTRNFLDFLIYKRVIVSNYLLQLDNPKVDRYDSPYVALTDSEVRRMIDTPDRNTLIGASQRLSLIFGFYLGLRASEIASLKHMDLCDGRLTITGKGSQKRIIPLPDIVLEEIRAYTDMTTLIAGHPQSAGDPILLSEKSAKTMRHIDRATVWRWFVSVAKLAGIKKKVSTHCGRATAITKALDEGASIRDVSILAGHKSIETTAIYDKRRGEASMNTVLKIRY